MIMDEVGYCSALVGLRINPTKTKVMSDHSQSPSSISVDCDSIEQVKEFVYFGSLADS
jgi:hypothetical protein